MLDWGATYTRPVTIHLYPADPDFRLSGARYAQIGDIALCGHVKALPNSGRNETVNCPGCLAAEQGEPRSEALRGRLHAHCEGMAELDLLAIEALAGELAAAELEEEYQVKRAKLHGPRLAALMLLYLCLASIAGVTVWALAQVVPW